MDKTVTNITRNFVFYEKTVSGILFERKFAQYLDKMLELISRYSKMNYICNKGEMCYDGR